jgi:hypothetical protein
MQLRLLRGRGHMKFSLFLSATILVAGCAKTATPPKAAVVDNHVANIDDCQQVYNRMLVIALATEVDPDHTFSDAENIEALKSIDQHYTQRGNKAEWFRTCVGHANPQQIACMSNAEDLEAMGLCAKLFNHPTKN